MSLRLPMVRSGFPSGRAFLGNISTGSNSFPAVGPAQVPPPDGTWVSDAIVDQVVER